MSRRENCDLEYLEDIHTVIIYSNIIAAIQWMLKLEINKLAAINSSDFC